MDYFPTEVITVILSNLSVVSILRCRSVCKTWHSIIDSPQFPQIHLKKTTQSGNSSSSSFIFLPNFCNDIYFVTEDGNFPRTLKTKRVNLMYDGDDKLHAEPPVNGLLFVHTSIIYPNLGEDDYSMFICNPATRDFMKLPKFIEPGSRQTFIVTGFGFDEVNKEFKVVQIFVFRRNRVAEKQVQVYTLGSNSWRKVGNAPTAGFFYSSSAFLNGALHWLGKDVRRSFFSLSIVTFNLDSEEFGVISSPNLSYPGSSAPVPDHFQLVALGGYLSVVDSSRNELIDIWIMKEYNVKESWTRYRFGKYNVNGVLCKTVHPISFSETGDIVLLYGSMDLISHNLRHGNVTSLQVEGLPPHVYITSPEFVQLSGAFSYTESLIPLKSAGILEGQPRSMEGN